MWHRTVPLDELRENDAHRLTLDGQDVCVTVIGERVHAISDMCPHRGASLSEGIVRDGCVTCPSHLWRFSFIDGAKQADERTRVSVYPTRVVDGIVEIDVPPLPPQLSLRETLLAHARGELAEGGST